jgi:hypothetical protein
MALILTIRIIQYQVLDTSILDTRAANKCPRTRSARKARRAAIPAPQRGAFARGIVAEPPVGADLCVCPKGDGADSPTRARQRRAKRLAQILFTLNFSAKKSPTPLGVELVLIN